ncbi:MAG: cytochrome b N-terminal domain-containing protein [Candidatus Dormibacteraeota bacterium]|nr:cytochrome b N-terminal domain-containing protein [Candidatus Dormibacteraeota bacterium]
MGRLMRTLMREQMQLLRSRTRLVTDWFDDRTNYRKYLREGLYEAVPVRGAWWYTLGSATLILILLQVGTGIFLTFQYVPSTTEAWSSLDWVKGHDPFGEIVRGLHLWGAYTLMFVIGLHAVRTFTSGSYKRPRELNWVTGVVLLLLVLGLSITGAFLPWDQAAYWTAVVVTNIPGYTPVIGDFVRTLWRGGQFVGPATLTRTFGIHIWLLPGALLTFILFHLLLLRKHGEFGSWVNYRGSWRTRPPDEPKPSPEEPDPERDDEPPYPSRPTDDGWSTPLETEDFYPFQTMRDSLVSAGLVALVTLLAIFVPAPLEARPDPSTTTYVPTPEWFYLPLDQLLLLLPKQLIVLIIFLPLAGVLFLFAVPWIDRSPERDPFERALIVLPALVIVLFILILTLLGAGRLFTLPPP